MKLSIIISPVSNLFTSIHRSEKKNLAYKNIRRHLEREQVELFFYGRNKSVILKQWESVLEKEDIKKFKKEFALAEAIFVSHWNIKRKHLESWKKYLKSNEVLFCKVFEHLQKISGVKNFKKNKVPIYLVSVPKMEDEGISAWFSWTPKESFIVAEIPYTETPPKNLFPLSVLMHEFFHLMIRKNSGLFSLLISTARKNRKKLKKAADGMPYEMFLEEMLMSSFLPEGYLGEKYFFTMPSIKIGKKPKRLEKWRRMIAEKMKNDIKEYTSKEKKIDKKFLKKLVENI